VRRFWDAVNGQQAQGLRRVRLKHRAKRPQPPCCEGCPHAHGTGLGSPQDLTVSRCRLCEESEAGQLPRFQKRPVSGRGVIGCDYGPGRNRAAQIATDIRRGESCGDLLSMCNPDLQMSLSRCGGGVAGEITLLELARSCVRPSITSFAAILRYSRSKASLLTSSLGNLN
jgi:hypothetical protein